MGHMPTENSLPRICRSGASSVEDGIRTTQQGRTQHPLVESASGVPLPLCSEAILFDAGDILYDATAWWRWVVKLLAHFDVHTYFDASYHVWQREYLQQVRRGQADYWTAFALFLQSVGMRSAQIQEALAASQPRFQQLHDRIRPLPEVASTLAKLVTYGLRLGVANHAVYDSEQMTKRLGDAGLARYFDFVVTTGDTQLITPTVEFYSQAAREFSSQLHAIVFVGHDVEELLLAKAAGLTTVACNHRSGANVDVSIDRFARLGEIIRRPSSSRQVA